MSVVQLFWPYSSSCPSVPFKSQRSIQIDVPFKSQLSPVFNFRHVTQNLERHILNTPDGFIANQISASLDVRSASLGEKCHPSWPHAVVIKCSLSLKYLHLKALRTLISSAFYIHFINTSPVCDGKYVLSLPRKHGFKL